MRKIIIILLTVSAYFFNLNCCEGHWLFPDGDRITAKAKAIVSYFIPRDITDTRFECSVCHSILCLPEGSSTGDIFKELRDHLTKNHPEEMSLISNPVTRLNLEERLFCSAQPSSRLPKKAQFAKLTKQ